VPPPQRHATAYLSRSFPAPLNRTTLSTNDNVRRELISSIQLYSEVKDLGRTLLRRFGHPDAKKSFDRFQSYIRQSIAFFEGAETLRYRSSPLLYYYSFMNLVKAITFLRDPTFPFGHIHHGLIPSRKNGVLANHFVTVAGSGVFPRFYSQLTGNIVQSHSKLTIKALLGYVSAISFEYTHLNFGQVRYSGCRYAIVRFHGEQEFRAVLVVTRLAQSYDTQLSRMLSKGFTEITLDQVFLVNAFNLAPAEMPFFSCWESRATFPSPDGRSVPSQLVVNATMTALSDHVSFVPIANWPILFVLNLKLRTPRQLIMNEIFAIYAVMFFLGSLVRYRPEILESMLATKDAWLIESFIRSAPIAFLRHARNLIDGNYLAFNEQ